MPRARKMEVVLANKCVLCCLLRCSILFKKTVQVLTFSQITLHTKYHLEILPHESLNSEICHPCTWQEALLRTWCLSLVSSVHVFYVIITFFIWETQKKREQGGIWSSPSWVTPHVPRLAEPESRRSVQAPGGDRHPALGAITAAFQGLH